MVIKMWEYSLRTFIWFHHLVSFGTTANKILIIIKKDSMLASLHMSHLMFTAGVESDASREPHNADYLKPSWLFYLIVNHSVEWITDFQQTHHCAFLANSRYRVCNMVNTASRNPLYQFLFVFLFVSIFSHTHMHWQK